jgi:hypothetical protein
MVSGSLVNAHILYEKIILRQPPSGHNGIDTYVPDPLYFMAETFF